MDDSHPIAYWDQASVKTVTEALANQVHTLAETILALDPGDRDDRSDIWVAMREMRTCLAAIRDFGG